MVGNLLIFLVTWALLRLEGRSLKTLGLDQPVQGVGLGVDRDPSTGATTGFGIMVGLGAVTTVGLKCAAAAEVKCLDPDAAAAPATTGILTGIYPTGTVSRHCPI